ncbi:MAG: hypothetical protein PVH41_04835 [Anaerolineae bacterium]|jgi:hypothetical protein
MSKTPSPAPLSDLERYARACIAAEKYPGDYHRFTPFGCRVCGVVPLAVRLDHHTGSKPGDFKGVVLGRCSLCGLEARIFTFTGDHRKRVRQETPICDCGHQHFWVAMVERIEGGQGLSGFFDEGVIVAKCSRCRQFALLASTD